MDRSLFSPTPFRSHAGLQLPWRIDCTALTRTDWETLARLTADLCAPFASVEGIPRGGVPFATALRPYSTHTGPALIVDDVCTTGTSLEQQRGDRPDVKGCVVFARGPLPSWVVAIWTLADPARVSP